MIVPLHGQGSALLVDSDGSESGTAAIDRIEDGDPVLVQACREDTYG